MEEDKDGKLQILVSLEGGLVASVQVFRSQKSAERFWDVPLQEAKHQAGYEKLSPAKQKEFDQDPFGFAYSGENDFVWEEATAKD